MGSFTPLKLTSQTINQSFEFLGRLKKNNIVNEKSFLDFKKYLEKENLLRSKVEDEKKMDDDEALITETRKRK